MLSLPYLTSKYLLILYLLGLANAQTNSIPFAPPAVPLAVVHPYLSTWLYNGTTNLASAWSQFSVTVSSFTDESQSDY